MPRFHTWCWAKRSLCSSGKSSSALVIMYPSKGIEKAKSIGLLLAEVNFWRDLVKTLIQVSPLFSASRNERGESLTSCSLSQILSGRWRVGKSHLDCLTFSSHLLHFTATWGHCCPSIKDFTNARFASHLTETLSALLQCNYITLQPKWDKLHSRPNLLILQEWSGYAFNMACRRTLCSRRLSREPQLTFTSSG